ncbi:MAG: hypothetical protein H5T43_04775 [Methanomethylovorans sp.]|jgi:hypothetical protein|nr:hypothetical protein [Methanomethylovorans sp.]
MSTVKNNKQKNIQKDDDYDADYKPILQGIINTHCNYDGSKIEEIMEF